MSAQPQPRAAMILAVAFAALWGVMEVTLGAVLSRPYDLLQVVWCRYATHLVLLVAACALFWRVPFWRTRRPALQHGRSLLMLVMPASFAWALGIGAGADFVWAEFWVITPLATLLLARLLLGERPPANLWGFAVLVSVAGLIAHDFQVPKSLAQLALPVATALSFCLYVVATRSLRDEPLATNLFYTAFLVFLVLTPFMPSVWLDPSLHDAIALMGIGAVGLVALALLDRAVTRGGVSIVALAVGMHIPFTAILAALELGRVPRRGLVALALLAGMLAWLWRHASSTEPRGADEMGGAHQ